VDQAIFGRLEVEDRNRNPAKVLRGVDSGEVAEPRSEHPGIDSIDGEPGESEKVL
jgi:hypothetical protein